MNKDNIVDFGRFKQQQKQAELFEIAFSEEEGIDAVIMEGMSDMIAFLCEVGYEDIVLDDYIYDVSLIYESFRSLLLKYKGHEHPIQETAQKMYSFLEKNPYQLELDFGTDI